MLFVITHRATAPQRPPANPRRIFLCDSIFRHVRGTQLTPHSSHTHASHTWKCSAYNIYAFCTLVRLWGKIPVQRNVTNEPMKSASRVCAGCVWKRRHFDSASSCCCMPKEFSFGILPFCTHINISGNVVGFAMASQNTGVSLSLQFGLRTYLSLCVRCEDFKPFVADACPCPPKHLRHQWISNEFLIIKNYMEHRKIEMWKCQFELGEFSR